VTTLSFDEDGVDVVYEGTAFRLESDLVAEAVGRPYIDVTDHQVLQIVDPEPAISGEPRRIGDIVD